MASVTSLDQDVRKLRMDRYTPAAAREVQRWIEGALQEDLPAGDLMESLRDGVALCKLVNLIAQPGIRYKASSMPFVQMENISNFLRACEMPPLSLPAHDRFLTVDLYDQKDPAQVLQCLAAFSRKANAIDPATFPTTIGAKSNKTTMSPNTTGPTSPFTPKASAYIVNTPPKPTYGSVSPSRKGTLGRGGLSSSGPVSSWSNKTDEDKTAPAWNIHQYGYMGGANQGNQGVAFGGRRQIVSPQPDVPSLMEKEKRLREKMEQEQKSLGEAEARIQAARESEELQAQEDEQRRWAEETKQAQAEEDRLRRQEQAQNDPETGMKADRTRQRTTSDARLNGQFLSQYQASQAAQARPAPQIQPQHSAEKQRIAELERQLAEAKAQIAQRERSDSQPQTRPQERPEIVSAPSQTSLPPRPSAPTPNTAIEHQESHSTSHEDDWTASERDALRKAHKDFQQANQDTPSTTTIADETPPEPRPAFAEPVRPLPATPTTYSPGTTRTSRVLTDNPAPFRPPASSHVPSEAAHSTTAEVDAETARRLESQRATKAGGWASKSLLEREMERERERQREWEENQKAVSERTRDATAGAGPGQSWDINQYGYTGGDNQNRGNQGIGAGRRQIMGPRPPP